MLNVDFLMENEVGEDLVQKTETITITRLEEKYGEGNGDIEIRSINASELFDIQNKIKNRKMTELEALHRIAVKVVDRAILQPNIHDSKLLNKYNLTSERYLEKHLLHFDEIHMVADKIFEISHLDNSNINAIQSKEIEKAKN